MRKALHCAQDAQRQHQAEGNDMRAAQPVWVASRVERRRAPWPLRRDLLGVSVVCVIFGLQIVALMQTTGGPAAYSQIASEGMQSP
jgi:hypothetical protein